MSQVCGGGGEQETGEDVEAKAGAHREAVMEAEAAEEDEASQASLYTRWGLRIPALVLV